MHSQQKISGAEEQEDTDSPDTSTRGVKEPSSGIGAISKGKTRRGDPSYPAKEKEEVHSSHPVRIWEYNMTGHAAGCVERYLELAGMDVSSLKYVGRPAWTTIKCWTKILM